MSETISQRLAAALRTTAQSYAASDQVALSRCWRDALPS